MGKRKRGRETKEYVHNRRRRRRTREDKEEDERERERERIEERKHERVKKGNYVIGKNEKHRDCQIDRETGISIY